MLGRRLTVGLRLLLGITMVVVGALKFVRPEFKVASDPTLEAFIGSGWLWQLIGAAELAGGLALASGLYVPLGLAVLAPVTAGILAFSIRHGGEELWVGLGISAVHLYLAWRYVDSYRPLLQRRPSIPRSTQQPSG
jgi:putative oxidoreductase